MLIFIKTEPSVYFMPVHYTYFNKMKSRKVIITVLSYRSWLLCDAWLLCYFYLVKLH